MPGDTRDKKTRSQEMRGMILQQAFSEVFHNKEVIGKARMALKQVHDKVERNKINQVLREGYALNKLVSKYAVEITDEVNDRHLYIYFIMECLVKSGEWRENMKEQAKLPAKHFSSDEQNDYVDLKNGWFLVETVNGKPYIKRVDEPPVLPEQKD